MTRNNSYIYFAFTGENFDPDQVTKKLGIIPTQCWVKGDTGKANQKLPFSNWQLYSPEEKDTWDIRELVNDVLDKLYGKAETIIELKEKYQLSTKLQVVLNIDINPDSLAPALGHEMRTIEFLYMTKTTTDVDIYTYDSRE